MVTRFSDSKLFILFVLLLFVIELLPLAAQNADDPAEYVVKPGDSLSKIAFKYGNVVWWIDIYERNKDKIDNPRLIFPGQQLEIPSYIAYHNILSLDMNKVMAMKQAVERSKKEAQKEEKLKKFRQAFKSLVEQEQKEKKSQSADFNENSYNGLALGGMVLDETRSKMGSNFYSIFYNHWEAPENTQHFTITISEQPVPSRGTMVQIEIDDQLVFRNRLEPRYYQTEQAAKQAVTICQRRLQQQASIQDQVTGY